MAMQSLGAFKVMKGFSTPNVRRYFVDDDGALRTAYIQYSTPSAGLPISLPVRRLIVFDGGKPPPKGMTLKGKKK